MTSIFLCGLASEVGMAAGFSTRRWVPFDVGVDHCLGLLLLK